ncbi:hypothetical protein EVAR_84430_1 [Eumeta japonica]|uniref:Uncharacterized protein n=1 Tax=Eumeta variegata TaxID=151549 RepID=A0A4C1W367_EUMVA|nr:hypothetical protein EVAR_84430_1 [Eumeta japonica]
MERTETAGELTALPRSRAVWADDPRHVSEGPTLNLNVLFCRLPARLLKLLADIVLISKRDAYRVSRARCGMNQRFSSPEEALEKYDINIYEVTREEPPAYNHQKAKSKYIDCMRMERASQEQSEYPQNITRREDKRMKVSEQINNGASTAATGATKAVQVDDALISLQLLYQCWTFKISIICEHRLLKHI